MAKFLILALLPLATTSVDVPTVPLMNAAKTGMRMPVIGIGTGGYVFSPATQPGEIWDSDVAEKAVGQWLALGGRRIDASYSYRDQPGVGRAIKASGIARKDIFVVSKVGSGGLISGAALGYNDTWKQVQPILDTLMVDYVDLLLIHWPGPPGNSSDPACQGNPPTWRACRQSTWKAMVDIYKSGKALAIGVSNFERNHLEDILAMGDSVPLPAVNQVEFHPYWHEDDLVSYCKSFNITFNGYSPLGCPDWAPFQHHWDKTILQEDVVQQIARTHSRTPAQVLLRWELQLGVVAQPRTKDPQHMKDNLNYFDFELTDQEMDQISNIPRPADPKVCPDPHQFK